MLPWCCGVVAVGQYVFDEQSIPIEVDSRGVVIVAPSVPATEVVPFLAPPKSTTRPNPSPLLQKLLDFLAFPRLLLLLLLLLHDLLILRLLLDRRARHRRQGQRIRRCR